MSGEASFHAGRHRVRPGRTLLLASLEVSEASQETTFHVECPHCHKPFDAVPLEGSAARYHGFKCPHCRLFVPFERVAEQETFESSAETAD
jgi:hypothetical protein